MNLKIGNVIEIHKEKFDVIDLFGEIDFYDTENDKIVGIHTEINLHKFGDPTLHPTHRLRIYDDDQENAILDEITQERPPEWLEKPRERGNLFSYCNKQKIRIADIKITR